MADILDDTEQQDELLDMEKMLAEKKKKKKNPKKTENLEKGTLEKKDYTYIELLERLYSQLQKNNPIQVNKKQCSIPTPQISKFSRKIMLANFMAICNAIHRQPDHLMAFILTELSTEGNLDGNKRLLIKGKFAQNQIESILMKYMTEYVMCNICRVPDTSLTRDPITRLYFVDCDSCKSKRSVAPIKTGFHATSRTDRKNIKKIN